MSAFSLRCQENALLGKFIRGGVGCVVGCGVIPAEQRAGGLWRCAILRKVLVYAPVTWYRARLRRLTMSVTCYASYGGTRTYHTCGVHTCFDVCYDPSTYSISTPSYIMRVHTYSPIYTARIPGNQPGMLRCLQFTRRYV